MAEKIPVPLRDRVLADNYMAFAMGPLANLTRENLVAAVYAVARAGRQHRIGLLYGNDAKTLLWDETLLHQTAADMVSEVPAMTEAELTAFCVREASRKSSTPLRFVVTGAYIIYVVDHTVADATETFQALKSVMQKMQDPAAELDERTLATNPTWAAFWHTFKLNRVKLRAALSARKRTLYPSAPTPTGSGVQRVSREDALVLSVINTEQTREVQRYSRSSGGSLNSVLLAALLNRLQAADIPLAAVRATYNLRQYLPQAQTVGGNFIAAQQVAGGSAKEIAEQMSLSAGAGAPLLAASIGALRNTLHGGKTKPHPAAQLHDGRMQLTFSGLGVVRALETMPWQSKDEHFYTGFTKPGPAGELTVNAVKMKGKIYISGSYNAAVYTAELMRHVFDDVAAEPIRWAEQSS